MSEFDNVITYLEILSFKKNIAILQNKREKIYQNRKYNVQYSVSQLMTWFKP